VDERKKKRDEGGRMRDEGVRNLLAFTSTKDWDSG
jgi:hypothetical protein